MINQYPLPDSDEPDSTTPDSGQGKSSLNPAAELIRSRIEELYSQEPSIYEESEDLTKAGQPPHSSHQKFMLELRNSGKSEAEIQQAWHDYYAGLTDKQKHEVWQEFYRAHAEAAKAMDKAPVVSPQHYKPTETKAKKLLSSIKQKTPTTQLADNQAKAANNSKLATVSGVKEKIHSQLTAGQRLSRWQHIKSMLFGLGVGLAVVCVLLFGFFNERIIAPFITPSKTVTNTPIISQSSEAVGQEPKIIVPKINLEVPVIYGEKSVDEKSVQKALESGVLHYADTAEPGEKGNVVVVGHSSNNIFNKGRYKFAFVLLNRLENEDLIMVNKGGVRYTYKVYEKKVVKPSQVDILKEQSKPSTITLVTCDPPGTSLNRLVVVAEQVSPDPNANIANNSNDQPSTIDTPVIPGNAPSLWSRLTGWL